MKFTIYFTCLFLLIFILSSACQDNNSKEWLLIKELGDYKLMEDYLLNNHDSYYFKEGLELIIKLKDKADTIPFRSTYPNYFERNVVTIILENDSIPYCEMEVIGIEAIDNLALSCLINEKDNLNMPEKKVFEFNFSKNRIRISKCHFYIVVKEAIDLAIVRKVTKQLSNTILIYKNTLLNQKITGPKISKLDLKKIIDKEFKNRVQYFRYNKFTERYPFYKY